MKIEYKLRDSTCHKCIHNYCCHLKRKLSKIVSKGGLYFYQNGYNHGWEFAENVASWCFRFEEKKRGGKIENVR